MKQQGLDKDMRDSEQLMDSSTKGFDKVEEIFYGEDITNINNDIITAVDTKQKFDELNYKISDSIANQLEFKDSVRKTSIWAFSILSILLLINLTIMLYLPGFEITQNHFIPEFDSKVVVVMISATFLNIFTLMGLIFKYIFSPVNDLLSHNKDTREKN